MAGRLRVRGASTLSTLSTLSRVSGGAAHADDAKVLQLLDDGRHRAERVAHEVGVADDDQAAAARALARPAAAAFRRLGERRVEREA